MTVDDQKIPEETHSTARAGSAGPVSEKPEQADETEEISELSFGRLWAMIRPHRWPVFIATGLMLVGSAVGLAIPWMAGQVVDVASDGASAGSLRNVVFGLIGVFAIIGVLGATEHYLLGAAGARLMRSLRQQVYDHLTSLSPAFFSERRVGELLSRLTSDLAALRSALTEQIPGGAQAVLRFVGTLGLLLWLQTKLTLVALLVVPPVVILAMVVGRRLEKVSTAQTDAAAAASGFAEESLSGIRTVQSFGYEDGVRGRYGNDLDELLEKQLYSTKLYSVFIGAMTFSGFTAFALVLGYGGHLLMENLLTVGELTAFLLYTFGIATSVGQLGSLYASYRQLKGSSARVFGLLDEVSTVQDPERPLSLASDGDATQGVILDSVEFAYPGQPEPALAEVSIAAAAGEVIGLVGPSGGGKSTIFALLQRFYDPQQGRVTINGVDTRDLRIQELRSSIAVVPQDIFLFSGTVQYNLCLARPEATRSEVRSAAQAAGAHEFIEALSEGYDTEVGERGVKLSAGQRQRLAIARAFLADRPLLLLDEATSALDPDSEAHVQRAIDALVVGRTTFVIAHRLATAKRADRLLVLEDGAIAASGNHQSLLSDSELYRRYWELQSLEHEHAPPAT